MGVGIGIADKYQEHLYLGEVVKIITPVEPVIEINVINLTLPVPPGTIAGDMLMALISTDGNPTMTLPAGWTAEDSIGGTAKSFMDFNLSDGLDPATYTWILSGIQDAIGAIIRFVNVDPDDPINAKVTNNGNGAVINVPSITTTVENTMLLTLISLNDGILIDQGSLRDARQHGLWLVNSSGAAIGSVGSSASYKTLKKAKTYPAYTLNTQGAVVTDYYIIQIALAPDVDILFRLLDGNADKLTDGNNDKLFAQ